MEEPDIVFTEEEAEGLDRMVMQTIEADIRIKEASDKAKIKGIAKGRAAATKESKILIAKNMLKNNLSIDIIQKVTGLSLKTIKNIII